MHDLQFPVLISLQENKSLKILLKNPKYRFFLALHGFSYYFIDVSPLSNVIPFERITHLYWVIKLVYVETSLFALVFHTLT